MIYESRGSAVIGSSAAKMVDREWGSDLIDLHCHLLPEVDDGAKDVEMSLAMARMASSEGISTVACTPHIMPGAYANTGPSDRAAVARLRQSISEAGIPVHVVTGADVHIAPDLVVQLRDGLALTLNDSRYLLLEPPHHLVAAATGGSHLWAAGSRLCADPDPSGAIILDRRPL